jgi:hypothetical protein
MGDICVEIGLRPLRRAHTAEIAGHLGIEMKRNQIREVIFANLLGG